MGIGSKNTTPHSGLDDEKAPTGTHLGQGSPHIPASGAQSPEATEAVNENSPELQASLELNGPREEGSAVRAPQPAGLWQKGFQVSSLHQLSCVLWDFTSIRRGTSLLGSVSIR